MAYLVTLLGVSLLIALVVDSFRRRPGRRNDEAEALAEADRQIDAIEREAQARRADEP